VLNFSASSVQKLLQLSPTSPVPADEQFSVIQKCSIVSSDWGNKERPDWPEWIQFAINLIGSDKAERERDLLQVLTAEEEEITSFQPHQAD